MYKKVIVTQQNPDVLDIVQITDCHIFSMDDGRFYGVDTSASLDLVVDRLNAAETPDLVLVTGDLVNDVEPAAYQRLLTSLKRLKTRVYCLPGNHDMPSLMHGIINEANVATAKVLECRNWRIVLLDTMLPELHSGSLSASELTFLEESLRGAGDRFVLVAMHHHPVSVESPWMDTMMLDNPEEFFAVLDNFPAVKVVTWGHIHQVFSRCRNDVKLLGTPSTCRQFRLDGETSEMDDKPPAYRKTRLHKDGALTTEIRWVAP